MVHRNIHDKDLNEAVQHENGIAVLGIKFQFEGRPTRPPRGNVNPGRRNEGLQMLRDIIYDKLQFESESYWPDDIRMKVP